MTMKFNIEHIASYYKYLQESSNYPKDSLYELFLIGKLYRDKDVVKEISEILEKYAGKAQLKAFKTRNKLPEKLDDTGKLISTLVHFAAIDPGFPIGKLYNMLGYTRFFLSEESVAKKISKDPSIILRLQGITGLNITNVFASGIPEEFGTLSGVNTLYIKGPYTVLPDSFSNFKNLEVISLKTPCLQKVPEYFSQLKQLKELTIDQAKGGETVTLEMPTDLQQLSNLETLKLKGLTTKNIDQLKLPTSIRILELENLENLKTLPDLSSLKILEEIKVFDCPSLTKIPDNIHQLKTLKKVRFKRLPKVKEIDDTLVFMPDIGVIQLDDSIDIINTNTTLQVSKLTLYREDFLAYMIKNPESFPNLKELEIYSIKELPQLASGLESLPALETIACFGMNDCDFLFANLGACRKLSTLKLWNSEIEKLSETLKNIDLLDSLEIQRCPNLVIESDVLPQKINNLDLLNIKEFIPGERLIQTEKASFQSLSISNMKNFFSKIVAKSLRLYFSKATADPEIDYSAYFPKPEYLKKLQVIWSTAAIKDVLKHCPQLEKLFIENQNESEAALNVHPATQLKGLKLDYYKAQNVKELLQQMPNLQALSIENNQIIKDFPAVQLPHLEKLSLSRTELSSLAALEAPKLNDLEITLCYAFDKKAYAGLNQFTALQRLHLMGVGDDIKTIPESLTSLDLIDFNPHHKIEKLPDYVKEFSNLETLYFDGIHFIDFPKWVADLQHLQYLGINNCTFENAIPEYFKKLKLKEVKYFISKFSGNNIPSKTYQNLITPNYTKLKKKFSHEKLSFLFSADDY
ncbi:leucine-rich repeat domain-containing protein [Pseudoalteromonas rhizosphaerae]|uniref:Leucine-rich repeat domain-containing protein n=1 Tax=Pseudoalteromonas rhizosphaerae TaxID=2518973 RepID=A0ABW8L1P1_9GAMM